MPKENLGIEIFYITVLHFYYKSIIIELSQRVCHETNRSKKFPKEIQSRHIESVKNQYQKGQT